jgi:flagellar assembly protein FliH
MSSSSFTPLIEGGPIAPEPGFQPLLGGETVASTMPGGSLDSPVRAEESEPARQAFQAGYELGREEVQSQLESVAESFVKSLEELGEFRHRLRERYERELLEVALGVAKKVVQQELTERPEIWLGMIRAAVRRAVDREHITIRVPATLATFLRAWLEDVKELEIVEDPSITAGGCVVESRFGDVDVGIETQLAGAERVLVRAED